MATYHEALFKAIESDLPNFHRRRMAERKGEQAASLAKERAKAHPDAKRVETLIAEMIQTERNKRDVSITRREVLDPLRELITKEQKRGTKDLRAAVTHGPKHQVGTGKVDVRIERGPRKPSGMSR